MQMGTIATHSITCPFLTIVGLVYGLLLMFEMHMNTISSPMKEKKGEKGEEKGKKGSSYLLK